MNGLDEAARERESLTRSQKVTVKVPASSANIGPGFDSIGVALNLYLILQAERASSWEITALSPELFEFPSNEQNFISQIAIKTAKMYEQEMPPLKMSVKSDIPLARGLGSSASAIVAGIELADAFCALELSLQEKLQIATMFEGHPDNVGACLNGGFVIGSQIEEEVQLTVLETIDFDPVLVVPRVELLTEESRDVLPGVLEYGRAVHASAISNQLIAALITSQWQLAGKMIQSDLFHQPYRKELVPFYDDVQAKAIEAGAFGVALSGAGPSILCLAEPGKGGRLEEELRRKLTGFKVHALKIDRQGCRRE